MSESRSRTTAHEHLPVSGRPKVFGLGLSRTGTLSLTAALRTLGFDIAHYPADQGTYHALLKGTARFPLLAERDGITDITVVPYYEELDLAWPGAKFILTVREEADWLRSCERHWQRPIETKADQGEVYLDLQRFLRAAVYGCHAFQPQRFARVYRRHIEQVKRYFAGREGDLLVLDICGGQGYELLARFLGVPVPDEPFPELNRRATTVNRPTAATPAPDTKKPL
ncbi:sulfotransferase family protein [Streptomyces sp. NPDC052101]|uniref:sulfotransferase family protein n=1 Tax=Streptomyces sp. NPDC052101 TaxID=3155763 RepID=UPI00341B7532